MDSPTQKTRAFSGRYKTLQEFDNEDVETLKQTATFASFSCETPDPANDFRESTNPFQSYGFTPLSPPNGLKTRGVSEVIDTEFSLISDRPEIQSDDLIYNKTELGYHTFQKPHHSDNDTFWGQIQLLPREPLPNSSRKALLDIVSAKPAEANTPAPHEPAESEESASNLFIIKSQTKTGAKRIAKLNRIRALDPVENQSDSIHTESFFKNETRCKTATHAQAKRVEIELPNESKWVINPKLLQKIPVGSLQIRKSISNTPTSDTSRNMLTCRTISEEPELQTEVRCKPISAHRPRSDNKVMIPKRKIRLQIKTDIGSPVLTNASQNSHTATHSLSHNRNFESLCGYNLHKIVKSTTPKHSSQKPPLSSDDIGKQLKPIKTHSSIVLRKVVNFFGCQTSKAQGNNSNDQEFALGKLNTIIPQSSLSSLRKRVCQSARNHHNRSTAANNSSNITIIESGSSLDFPVDSLRSEETADSVTSSSTSSERKKPNLLFRGQAKMLNKIFKFDTLKN